MALDRLVAALLGFDSRLTVSSVLAVYRPECRACRFLCRLLEKVDPEHCDDAILNWERYRLTDRSVWTQFRRRL